MSQLSDSIFRSLVTIDEWASNAFQYILVHSNLKEFPPYFILLGWSLGAQVCVVFCNVLKVNIDHTRRAPLNKVVHACYRTKICNSIRVERIGRQQRTSIHEYE